MSKIKKPMLSYHIDYGHIERNETNRCTSFNSESRVVYKQENLEELYQRLLGKALAEYNARQYRPDRIKRLESIMLSPKSFREVNIRFVLYENTDIYELEKAALSDYILTFEERNPCLKIFYAEMILLDETPLIRIDFIPICHGHIRGLSTAVSFKGALKEQGYYPVSKNITEQIMWKEREMQYIYKKLRQIEKAENQIFAVKNFL